MQWNFSRKPSKRPQKRTPWPACTRITQTWARFIFGGEYTTALAHSQKALGIARALGDQISTGKWLRNLTYKSMGNLMMATSYEFGCRLVNRKVGQARAAASAAE